MYPLLRKEGLGDFKVKIGINLLYLLPGVVGGTETYAVELLKGLAKINDQDDFFVFVNNECAQWPLPEAKNFYKINCSVNATNRLARYLFEQIVLPKLLKKYGIDIVHSLGYVAPLFTPCKSVVTIHDLNFITLRNIMSFKRNIALRFFSTMSAKKADKIITVSNFSKHQIAQMLKIDEKKVVVIYEASMENNSNIKVNWLELKKRYKIAEPYIVAFGGGSIHKNIPVLIDAYMMIESEFPHQLVLIGHVPSNVDIRQLSRKPDRIITTGFIERNDIMPILSHADAFVLPSLHEGFGLPILEAQQAHVPVISSMGGSLPEIAGDGAMYFHQYSVDDLSKSIRHVLTDINLRQQLILRGNENLNRFSWEKAARETALVYQTI